MILVLGFILYLSVHAGPQGRAQAWYHVVSGPSGISGPTGETGPTGITGPSGSTGVCGECETPTVEPTVEATPTAEVNQGGPGDNLSDHKSDGQHQGPDGLGCAAHECKPLGSDTTKLGFTGGPEPK